MPRTRLATSPGEHVQKGPPANKSMDLYVSNRCNEKCIFCLTSVAMESLRERAFDAGKLGAFLRTMRARGWNYLNLTGGEPLLYKDLAPLLTEAKELGFHVQLSTNGTLFARKPKLASTILPLVDYVCLAVHGHRAELHDFLTRTPSSFIDLKGAMQLFAGRPKVSFNTNTVLTAFNVEHIVDIVRFILDQDVFSHIVISNTCPVGDASSRYREVSFPMGKFLRLVPQIVDLTGNRNVKLTIFGFPLCVLDGHGRYSNDLTYEKNRLSAFCSEKTGRFTLIPDIQRQVFTKVEACASCALDASCQGVFRAYAATYGVDEIRPIPS